MTESAPIDQTSDRELRRRAEARIEAREGFTGHLLIFLAVNALLWGIWAFNGANLASPWPAFATVGWGIGLLAHWWTVYGRDDRRREAAIQAEMERLRGRGP
jgi:2TM domain-containing protein